ncbi:hypothetical protein QTI33_09520 [Variovorax sp. J22P271]|uniref:hypothetical protein n=1 Tax=Variovorax davisae TaxID=3053515 RepID=UPI0025774821|nr:hypothetical protein [Variovorax sp. J22P271]MDM0032362.1 hypothetical protein [Variovorax sp. J22P271]
MVNSSRQSSTSPDRPVEPAFGELATPFSLRAHTPAALQPRFPYMFPLEGEERRRAYIFFRGWLAPLARTCEDIDQFLRTDKRGFHWVRLREKFGSPSFAFQMEGRALVAINIHRPTEVHRYECEPVEGFDPVALAVDERVLQIEVELRSLCIVCGSPSEINNDRGPWASLCPVHRAEDDGPQGDMGSVWAAAQLKEGSVP